MNPIAQIPKPRSDGFAMHLLNPGILGTRRHRFAGDGDPGLIPAVEVQIGDVGILDVGEFLAVRVGEEEEVGAAAFGYCHCAADGLCVSVSWVCCAGFGGVRQCRLEGCPS